MMMNCVCKMIDQQMYYENKGAGTNYRLPICSEVLFVDSSPSRFDALIHRGFWIIPQITIGNLCKLFHGIISLFWPTSN